MTRNSNLISIGSALLKLCILCLILGNAITTISFPQYKNAALTQEALSILIPIGSIGILGVIFTTLGWIKNPECEPVLALDIKFSKITKKLGAFTSLFLMLTIFTLIEEIETTVQVFGIYSMLTCVAFLFYLCVFYIEEEDPIFLYLYHYLILDPRHYAKTASSFLISSAKKRGGTTTLAAFFCNEPALLSRLFRLSMTIFAFS